jgi:hypothetical protein
MDVSMGPSKGKVQQKMKFKNIIPFKTHSHKIHAQMKMYPGMEFP